MKVLSTKTNNLNISEIGIGQKGMPLKHGLPASITLKSKSLVFHANEKNGELSTLAWEMQAWCKSKGFELTSRPIGQSKKVHELWQGKMQDVTWQWTSYTIK